MQFIKHNELLSKLDELEEIFKMERSHENLLNVVIMALYILQPPLRNDYYNIIFIDDIEQETDKKQNYIIKAGGLYNVIINKDAMSRNHGRDVIPIHNGRLTDILNIYTSTYGRINEPLFMNADGSAFSKNKITYILKKLFKRENKILTIENLRKAYIQYYYNLNRDNASRENLARRMRHSQNKADLIYAKSPKYAGIKFI